VEEVRAAYRRYEGVNSAARATRVERLGCALW
jgi:hypothetical protein